MSAQEIIAELPKLKPEELRLVRERLSELDAVAASATPKTGWGKALLEIAGSVNGLPDDLAANHDFYLYGTHKQQPRRGPLDPARQGLAQAHASASECFQSQARQARRGFGGIAAGFSQEPRSLPSWPEILPARSDGPPRLVRLTLVARLTALSPIREPYASLICWKMFHIARNEQTLLSNCAGPDNGVRQLEPMSPSQIDCFLSDLCRQGHDAKMSEKPAANIFVGLGPRAG